jgi:hypothetical protein
VIVVEVVLAYVSTLLPLVITIAACASYYARSRSPLSIWLLVGSCGGVATYILFQALGARPATWIYALLGLLFSLMFSISLWFVLRDATRRGESATS